MKIDSEEWMRDARCREMSPEIFFPPLGESTSEAKYVCRGCPVRADCLAYAMENGENHGVWGGLTSRERVVLRTKRLKEAS